MRQHPILPIPTLFDGEKMKLKKISMIVAVLMLSSCAGLKKQDLERVPAQTQIGNGYVVIDNADTFRRHDFLPSPFTYDLQNNVMKVYANNNLIVSWKDYASHSTLGDVIVLVDTNGILGAYGADGRTIVNNYLKTKQVWLRQNFVAILDTDGVFDVYNTTSGARVIANWKDTIRVDLSYDRISLLDKNGIFESYNSDGKVIVKNYKDTKDFEVRQSYVAILDTNAIFDVYRNDGVRVVKYWKDTTQFVTGWDGVAVVDKNGIMDIYQISTGKKLLRADSVTEIQKVRGGVYYFRKGAWVYNPL